MSEILDDISFWVFLIDIESVLLLVLVKYMLCIHFTQNYVFLYSLEAKNPYFVTQNCWKSSLLTFVYLFCPKNGPVWFHKNLRNSGMVGRRKLPDLSLNHIFNALSIGVQYTISFQWTIFGLSAYIKLKW